MKKHLGKVLEEFSETESGRNDKRPQLLEALRICRMRRATLLIARLDRLSRSFSLISNLCESDIEFVAVDLPEANRFTIHLLAAISEYETKQMSDRIKAALAIARARGVKLGGNKGLTPERIQAAQKAAAIARTTYALAKARDLAPLAWQLRIEGKSCRQIATELERLGIRPPRGDRWYDSTVRKILLRTREEFTPDGEPYTHSDVRRKQYEDRVRSFAPLILELRSKGMSFSQIASEFDRRQIKSPRNRTWNSSTIFRYATAMRYVAGANISSASDNSGAERDGLSGQLFVGYYRHEERSTSTRRGS